LRGRRFFEYRGAIAHQPVNGSSSLPEAAGKGNQHIPLFPGAADKLDNPDTQHQYVDGPERQPTAHRSQALEAAVVVKSVVPDGLSDAAQRNRPIGFRGII